jgi:tellurite resistance protein
MVAAAHVRPAEAAFVFEIVGVVGHVLFARDAVRYGLTPEVLSGVLAIVLIHWSKANGRKEDASMNDMEKLELLQAAVAVAVADDALLRSERGVIEGLAAKAGVGKVSFEAMLAAARRGDDLPARMLLSASPKARLALELLVAEARIDGEINDDERRVLVEIAGRLGLAGDDFMTVYEAGIARADQIRQRRD